MDRTLTLDLLDGRRSYEAVAHCITDGMVGLRLTGWDRGRVVTELVGEIPAADALDVGGLLAAVLSGFRDAAPQDPGSGAAAVLDGAAAPRLEEGAGVMILTAESGRTGAGVRSRPRMSRAAGSGPGPPRPPG
ncbi:hypothetical protein [Dactylosporangium sp. NPDC048998]|uniref:hypothetical protein n=1 Tax=Dactylosporangium sp. NPDC048998 TaxID=3363976 RepID=UPI003722C9AB